MSIYNSRVYVRVVVDTPLVPFSPVSCFPHDNVLVIQDAVVPTRYVEGENHATSDSTDSDFPAWE